MSRLSVALFLVVAFCTIALAGKPKPRPTLVKLDPATEQIEDLKLREPKQPCLNWAWASIVEDALARQNVHLSQSELIMKADAGEVCTSTPLDLTRIKKVVEGIYVQPDGSKVQVDAIIVSGAPHDVGYLIRSIREKHPLLMLWMGHPFALKAVEFDEYVYPNDQRMYEARKLTLLDPMTDKPLVFEKGKDNAEELGGTLEIRVGPVEHFR